VWTVGFSASASGGQRGDQLLCQCNVTFSSSTVGPVVEMLDTLPRLPAVAVQVVLNSPPVV